MASTCKQAAHRKHNSFPHFLFYSTFTLVNLRNFLPASFSARIVWGICLFLLLYQYLYGFSPTVISWDTYGYYLYLPQTLIHGDLSIQDYAPIETALNGPVQSGTFYQAAKSDLGLWVIKYPYGLSVFYLPFFALGSLFAWIGGYALDGFSLPYQYMLTCGSLFFTFIGLYFLRKILLRYCSERVTVAVILLIVFGTNYLHMHTRSHGMAHVYLFTCYAALIWFTIRWHAERKLWQATVLGLILGLMTVSRVTEFLAILIPLGWGLQSPRHAFQRLRSVFRLRWHFLLAGIGFFFFLFPQLLYWKILAGEWLYDSYRNPGEGLDFLHPHTWQFLFSYRKGWLIYTPLMVFALWGIYRSFKENAPWRWAILGVTVFFVYVASSWTTWWYAASFSQRPMVQLYPVLALPLGLALAKGEALRKGVLSFAALFLALNLFQTWQYNEGIIHIDRMTKTYYWKVFGRTSIPEGATNYLLVNRSMGPEENFTDPYNYKVYRHSFLGENEHRLSPTSADTKDTLRLLPGTFLPKYEERFDELCKKDHAWIGVRGKIHADSSELFENIFVITTFEHKGEAYKFNYKPLKQYVRWNSNGYFDLMVWYLTPEVRRPDNQYQFYLHHTGTEDTLSLSGLELYVLQRLDKFD